MATTIVWFRNDLRLTDHLPLVAAAQRGPVVPVFILDPDESLGGASKWWLHRSLDRLDAALRQRHGHLVLRRGEPGKVLQQLLKETGANAVYWQRRYEPAIIERDKKIKKTLGEAAQSFVGGLLREPWEVTTKQGRPYRVFTPFWRAHQQLPDIGKPVDAPSLSWPKSWPKSDTLDELGLLPRIQWYDGMDETWTPGEAGAAERLQFFVDHRATDYAKARDLPATDGTSMLSPHLHFGEVSPRQILHAARPRKATDFIRELIWREFAHHVLYHFPRTVEEPMYAKYAAFPWHKDNKALKRWQRGETGYPLVDAGMRELWHTGWMHNRVRMVVASFLVKDLLIDWRDGAAWFMDTLVDADLANNTLNWQWAAGCGADAAPYFRIFNPTTQAKKFDPAGDYIRHWVPELRDAPLKTIHQPYGTPLVDHAEARDRALAALATLKQS